MSIPESRRRALSGASVVCMSFLLLSCDRVKDDFVSECQKVTNASSADCSCSASKVKEILGPERWKVAGDLLSGDRQKAEMTMAKEGLGGMFGFLGQWSMALGTAERQCGVRGLSRM